MLRTCRSTDRNAVARRQAHKADGTSLPGLTCQDPGLPAPPQPAWLEGGQPEAGRQAAALKEAYSYSPSSPSLPLTASKDSLGSCRQHQSPPHVAMQHSQGGSQAQRVICKRHGMSMLTYTAGTRDHRAARQSSHMQMGRREQ